jgi:hypothetical protein
LKQTNRSRDPCLSVVKRLLAPAFDNIYTREPEEPRLRVCLATLMGHEMATLTSQALKRGESLTISSGVIALGLGAPPSEWRVSWHETMPYGNKQSLRKG